MKKLLYILLLLPLLVSAQSNMNYVRTLNYTEATTTSDSTKARRSIVYYDAIGRPIQQIAGKMSAESKDIITHIEYDEFSRQPKQYLSYASVNDGLMFDVNALANTNTFYSAPYYDNTPNPYSQSFFEASPLNRVLKQAAPGAPWQGSTVDNNDKAVKFAYKDNLPNEVKRFAAAATWNSTDAVYDVAFNDAGHYSIAQLYKTVTTDENGVNTEEFKNQLGQVVLKRAYEGTEKHDTYYVYDQYGNLSFVLPPLAEGQLSEGLCYYYKYDRRNRLVEKKLPGKQWEFIVYDSRDRVVATGPALSPFGAPNSEGWIHTYYEDFDRPAITGWVAAGGIDTHARAALQALNNGEANNIRRLAEAGFDTIDNIDVGYSTRSYVNQALKLLTVNYYDRYLWPGGPSAPAATSQVYNQYLMRVPKGISVGSWARVLTDENGTAGDMSFTNYDVKGRVIRSRTNNYLGGYTQINTKLDFDGTVQETYTANRRSASDNSVEAYDFFTYTAEDRLLKHTHQIGSTGTVELLSLNTYDKLGQLTGKKTGGADLTGAAALQKVDFSYNIRGWLKGINDVAELNPTTTENDLFAFKINYTDAITDNPYNSVNQLYNGNIAETYWRTASDNIKRKYGYSYDQLNRLKGAYYQKPDNAIKLTNSYNENLTYDKNGNILTLQRTGDYDDAAQSIGIDNLAYTYDTTVKNRLAKVVDSTNSPSGFKDSPDNDEDDYTYDANGNMVTDRNKGITSIKYNHLNLPVEIVFDSSEVKKITYIYNAAGIKRAKTSILPPKNPETIVFPTQTDYLDGFQYADAILQYFPTAEGYVDVTRKKTNGFSVYNYVYHFKDHLGNIRMNYAWDPADNVLKIKEENHYYPFGLKHSNYNVDYLEFQEEQLEEEVSIVALNFSDPQLPPTFYKDSYDYRYNGKELQSEFGLNMYDYGARNYDPALARWHNIDPLAEVSRRWSPYAYCYNNPMIFVDPDGMKADNVNDPDMVGPNAFVNFEEAEEGGEDVIISGAAANKAFAELQKSVNGQLNLSMDSGGKITYTKVKGATISANTQLLINAIDDNSITVNVSALNGYKIANSFFVGGAYMGNTVTTEPLTNIKKVSAHQTIQPDVLKKASDDYGKPGGDTLHEFTEAYQGALISQALGISSPPSGATGSVYPLAHAMATPQSGPVTQYIYDAQGNILSPQTNGQFPPSARRVDFNTSNGTTILSIP